MRTRVILLLILLIATPVIGSAQESQVDREPRPAWVVAATPIDVPTNPTGPVFVRAADSLVHLDDSGQTSYQGFWVRILHPNALQLGNLNLTWNPHAGRAVVHAVRIHRNGTIIDVLRNTGFTVLRRENQLEQAQIDGLLTAVLQVPDLRVGDELEVAMSTQSLEPTLGTTEYGLLFVAPQPPAGRLHFGISWAAGQEPVIRMTPLMAAASAAGTNRVDVQFDNAPTVAPPNLAPQRFNWQRILQYSDFPDWVSISRRFSPLYGRAATLSADSPLREEARQIAAAHTTDIARAHAALRLVQENVRYVYVGLNTGNFTPVSADETWERRFGDCKGKTVILLALLHAMGIAAEPVLVSNSGGDDGLDQRLPSPAFFDHVLVRATIGGETYWLDGTLPPAASPSTDPVLPYRWVLPLIDEGADLVGRPWRAAAAPSETTLYDVDARAGFGQPAIFTQTTIIRGIQGLIADLQLSAVGDAQLLSAMQQEMVGQGWLSVDEASYRYDADKRAAILRLRGTRTMDWISEGHGGWTLTLPGGGFSPPERRARPTSQDQEAPYYSEPTYTCFVTTVRVPSETSLTNWTHNEGFDVELFGRQYRRAFDMRDGAIRMIRIARTLRDEISPADAQADNARIADFDNSTAEIVFAPRERRPVRSSPTPVPTTDEIDWASSSTPCVTLLEPE